MSVDGLTDAEIVSILAATRDIAVVGASNKVERPSYGVMQFLIARGYRVIPVNPGLAGQTILGETVVPSLASLVGSIEMVDVFRNAAEAAAVVDEAIAAKDRLGIQTIWMQLGVINEAAAERARAAGLNVVMDRCPKIEIARLATRLGR